MEQTRACFSWQKGAGIYVAVGGNATLVDSNVYQNEASKLGGGLLIKGTAALTNVNVYANRAETVCASPFELCVQDVSFGATHNGANACLLFLAGWRWRLRLRWR